MKPPRHTCRLALAALLAWSLQPLSADQSHPLSLASDIEEQEFQDALLEARRDPANTASLVRFLRRHPASSRRADALLALEEAQLLTDGCYQLPDGYLPPDLTQLRPSQEHLQWFYDAQNALALPDGTPAADSLVRAARQRYERLYAMGDKTYQNEAAYYLGFLDYREGRLAEALKHFESLPDEPKYRQTVPVYRAQLLLAQGRYDDARKAAEAEAGNISLTAPQQLELQRIAGECALHDGQDEQALALLRQYVDGSTRLPVIASSAYNCALLAFDKEDHVLTQKALARVLEGSDADRGDTLTARLRQHAYLLMGQSSLLTGDYEQAHLSFTQAAASDADAQAQEAAAYNLAALIHENNYSTPFGEEVGQLETFLNNYPQSPYADRVSEYLTDCYMTSRNYETALLSANRIRQPNQRIRSAKQRLLLQLGVQDYVNGDYDGAEKRITESINIGGASDDQLAQAYYWRAEARYHTQDYAGAEKDYMQHIALTPAEARQGTGPLARIAPMAHYNLGYARFRLGRFDDAARSFQAYLAQPTQRGTDAYTDAQTRLGDCLYYQRRFADAEAQYLLARQGNPRAATADYALYQEAFMKGLQKKYDDKVAALQELIQTYPESDRRADAWLEIGRTYLLEEQHQNAINAFMQVTDHFSTSAAAPAAAIQMAMTYNNIGKTDDAIDAYKLIVARWPNTDEARTALEDLKTIYVDQNDVIGYDRYLASVSGGTGLTTAERDSLSLASARRLMGEGRTREAYQTLRTLLDATADTRLRREQLPVLQQMAYDEGDYAEALQAYEQIRKLGGLEARRLQEAQLLAAKASFQLHNDEAGLTLLGQAGADIRTAPGAEARYLHIQQLYDGGKTAEARTMAEACIRQGTPHQYWLARTILVYADILTAEGDTFRAQQYLKSLQKNYTATGDDIPALIAQRLLENE